MNQNKKRIKIRKSLINRKLNKLSNEFFLASNLNVTEKRKIFSRIVSGILKKQKELQELVVSEVKFTQKDAQKEITRCIESFSIAEKYADFIQGSEIVRENKIIQEKRRTRGPLLIITPFSSPLSSPAHKIACGLIAGTSILFKPSKLAKKVGMALYTIIRNATEGKYINFLDEEPEEELKYIIKDDKIGIISFTGAYDTGKKIIQTGGVKKYHMELSGGNSPVIFTPDFDKYDCVLIDKLLDGIIAKNGQRCVSIKHIFIPNEQKEFIAKIHDRLLSLKKKIQKDFRHGKLTLLGPLITTEYALHIETKVNKIIRDANKSTTLIAFERKEDFVFPTMYTIDNINTGLIKRILEYDLPGPVLFIYFYKNSTEFQQVIKALQNNYIRSGLQLSFYTKDTSSIKKYFASIFWGGIIINDVPTFRDEFMSFGGFGKSGLGKEGFFETINAFTDPQVVVTSL